MSPIETNALAVLSVVAASDAERMAYAQVMEQTRLNERDFNKAIDYLLKQGYIHRRIGSVKLTTDGEVMYHESKRSGALGKKESDAMSDRKLVSNPTKVFVVYGRNNKARKALFAFLRTIGLNPAEWSEWVHSTGQGSPYVGDVLRIGFQEAQAFVVLMTPDDEARLRAPFRVEGDEAYESELTPQPRPNVIFEAGMAMGVAPDRTIIVQLGKLRPMSDILGRHLVRLDNSAEKRKDLAQRLERAGCPVNLKGDDWLDVGDFDAALEVFDEADQAFISPKPSSTPLEVLFEYKARLQRNDHHEYYVEFKLKNTGTVKIDDFRVDIEFPLSFVNLNTNYWLEKRDRRTKTHMLLQKWNPNPDSGARTVLYPGDDTILLSMEYFVNDELFDMGALKEKVKVTVYSGNMAPVVEEIPMTDLTNF